MFKFKQDQRRRVGIHQNLWFKISYFFRIDFNQYKKAEPKLPHESAVLKYLRECEQETTGQNNGGARVANLSSHQENRNYSKYCFPLNPIEPF